VEEQCQKQKLKINYCFGWTKMTSARNTRVSFAKNAGIIGPLTHAPKTVKYFAGVNNLSQYNQYFFIISLKIETTIILIYLSQLTMASIHRQLILQGLPLPNEMIRAIKDYTFMDFVQSGAKNKKDSIIHHIARTEWCGKARPGDEYKGDHVFWIEADPTCIQIQSSFCKKCGNYKACRTPSWPTTCWC
jgi:hypothetical protein